MLTISEMNEMASNLDNQPPFLSTSQVAEITGENATAIAHRVKAGRYPVPARKIGNRYAFPTEKVLEYVGAFDRE